MTMTAPYQYAEESLLKPADLNEIQLQKVLNQLAGPQIDYADLYFQYAVAENWYLEDSIVKNGSFHLDQGVGVRAISGEKTGFAYSDDINFKALENAATMAKQIGAMHKAQLFSPQKTLAEKTLYPAINPVNTLSDAEKVNLLQALDRYARSKDPRIQRVSISLSGSYDLVFIAASDGTRAADVRPLVRLNVNVIASNGKTTEQGYAGGGARLGYDYFDLAKCRHYVDEAVRLALLNLEAEAAPAGALPVVLGAGWPGVLLHEAVGHGLEGDFNRKGTSAFASRMGQRVAAKGVTVVDDGTLYQRRGSLNLDDEGTPSRCNVLIEDGILKNYMQDKLNASLMGLEPTGNGRRESFRALPLPRMTNTYMLAGEHDPAEIIASVKKGIYAVNFAGGQVDITSGKFVFTSSEAYLIENGKITRPVKAATLIGNGPEVLTRVSMIGNDLKLDEGVGICGKDGQSVPVGVGQPTLKIDSLTVGGSELA